MRTVVAINGLEKMLVDNGSSINIIYRATFDKMEVDHELTPITSPLYEFTSDNIISRVKITIAMEIGMAPLTAHHFMEFLVVDYRSAYYGVFGRPNLKELWVVTSIYNLCIKFPTKNGIATIRGDQRNARKCYSNSIRKVESRSMNVILMDIDEIEDLKQGYDASKEEAVMEI